MMIMDRLNLILQHTRPLNNAVLWFLGKKYTRTKPVSDVVKSFFILLSSFTTMIAIQAVMKYGAPFRHRNTPPIPPWVSPLMISPSS